MSLRGSRGAVTVDAGADVRAAWFAKVSTLENKRQRIPYQRTGFGGNASKWVCRGSGDARAVLKNARGVSQNGTRSAVGDTGKRGSAQPRGEKQRKVYENGEVVIRGQGKPERMSRKGACCTHHQVGAGNENPTAG